MSRSIASGSSWTGVLADIQAELRFPIKSDEIVQWKWNGYGNVLIIDNTNIRSGRSVTQTIRISSECSPW